MAASLKFSSSSKWTDECSEAGVDLTDMKLPHCERAHTQYSERVTCSIVSKREELSALETLLTSAWRQATQFRPIRYIHPPGGAFSVISFWRAVIFDLRSDYRVKAIDRKLRPFCTLCESFNSIALVSREEKRSQTSMLVYC